MLFTYSVLFFPKLLLRLRRRRLLLLLLPGRCQLGGRAISHHLALLLIDILISFQLDLA